MEELSDKEKRRLIKLAEFLDEGDLALLKHIAQLEDRIDDATGHLVGPQGERGEKGEVPTDEELLALIKPLIPEPVPGEPGEKPSEEELLELIKPLIPQVKDGETPDDDRLLSLIRPLIKDPEELTGEDIVQKINDLPIEPEKQIDIKHIKGWKKELEKVSKGTFFAGGGSSGGGRIVKSYDISSQLNGVLKTFSLPAFYRVISVHSTSFPFSFRQTTDYTTDASAMTITFTSEIAADSTLATGQTVTVIYSEL